MAWLLNIDGIFTYPEFFLYLLLLKLAGFSTNLPKLCSLWSRLNGLFLFYDIYINYANSSGILFFLKFSLISLGTNYKLSFKSSTCVPLFIYFPWLIVSVMQLLFCLSVALWWCALDFVAFTSAHWGYLVDSNVRKCSSCCCIFNNSSSGMILFISKFAFPGLLMDVSSLRVCRG